MDDHPTECNVIYKINTKNANLITLKHKMGKAYMLDDISKCMADTKIQASI